MTIPGITQIRDFAHSAAAIVGILSTIYGALTLALQQSGLSIDARWSGYFMAVGAGIVILSKGIDSLNAALLGIYPGNTTAAPAATTPKPPGA